MAAAEDEFTLGAERQVTWYGSTSTCVGDPHSPVCAIDTMMACLVRRDQSLCNSVGIKNACRHPSLSGARYKIMRIEYAESLSRAYGAESVVVWFREQMCFSVRESCEGSFEFGGDEMVSKIGGRWLFILEPDLSYRLCFED